MMPVMKRYLSALLILLSLVTSVSRAQDVRVTATFDTTAIKIGEQVGLTLTFTGPENVRVLWPYLPDSLGGSLQVIGRGKIDTAIAADKRSVSITQKLNLTSFDSGLYTLPSIPFQYTLAPDTTGRYALSGEQRLAVHTVRVDTTQAFKPIAGPLSVPVTFREMLPWILLGILIIGVAVSAFFILKKMRNKEPLFLFKPKPVIPPHQKALEDLEKLRMRKLWQAGQVKEYYSELTEILRRYIEERYQVPALEQTTAEIMESLRQQQLCPADPEGRLERILVLADMVKFAKMQPLASENEQSMGEGVKFIQETTPVTNVGTV